MIHNCCRPVLDGLMEEDDSDLIPIGHICRNYPYVIKRTLRSGSRLLIFDCGHIQFRRANESLPQAVPLPDKFKNSPLLTQESHGYT